MELADVYAVEIRPGVYWPRSKALPTTREPKLWVRRREAERVASRERDAETSPRVIRFRLVEVQDG